MSWLLSRLPFLKGPARAQAPIVPTDEVVPVHLFDSTTALRSCILVWLFRFQERLDADKLHDSLSRVFQKAGWRKLGGRYRRRADDGKLEIHIPKPFTAQRPPVHFTRETFDTRIDEHPLASKLPRATGKVTTFTGPRAFNALAMGPGAPATFDDLIYDDKPQFSLHVSNFTDGTLVGLSHSHMTADLLGLTAVIEAWCQELAGESGKIKPFGGVEEDGMKGLYEPPTQARHVLAGKELKGLGLGYWGARALWESKSSRLASRTLCIPKTTMEKLVTVAKSKMTRQMSVVVRPDGRDANFISDGDVLAALMCRLNAQSQSTMSRNIVTMMALDPRTRAPSAFRSDVAYAGNSPTAVFFECSAQDAVDLPLGDLALHVRKTIAAQATEEQMKAYAAMSADSVRASNMNVMFGDRNMAFQLMSNWLKASLFEKIDFSPAILEEVPSSSAGPASKQQKRGHPVYYHSADPGDVEGPYIMHLAVIMGADHDGNIWMSCVLPENTWSNMVEYLDSL